MSSHNLGNIYGKPVGFGIVIAKIDQNHKEITFKTGWIYTQGESFILDSKKINIDYTNPKVGYETLEAEDYASVLDYVKNNGGEIISMMRFAVGEGIEKKQEDFASEVMSQIQNA